MNDAIKIVVERSVTAAAELFILEFLFNKEIKADEIKKATDIFMEISIESLKKATTNIEQRLNAGMKDRVIEDALSNPKISKN